jgi:hypothetical protein
MTTSSGSSRKWQRSRRRPSLPEAFQPIGVVAQSRCKLYRVYKRGHRAPPPTARGSLRGRGFALSASIPPLCWEVPHPPPFSFHGGVATKQVLPTASMVLESGSSVESWLE